MKTVIIAGAGQMGKAAAELLNANETRLIGFADNDEGKWNVFNEKGKLGKDTNERPVMPVEMAAGLEPDMFIIGVASALRAKKLTEQIIGAGYTGEIMLLKDMYSLFDIRGKVLQRISMRLNRLEVPGAVAELGVYKGDLAWQLRIFMPGRSLYLFDTFKGFDEKDVDKERERCYSKAFKGDFSDTSVEGVLERLGEKEDVHIMKGIFPDTATAVENEKFALVSLDADLFEPTRAGLEFFYPRLSPGGVILIHDYESSRFPGVKGAVDEYEKDYGPLAMIPLADLHGSCAVIRA